MNEPLDVDCLCMGSEAMTLMPRARGPAYNVYGPTEFTVDAACFELDMVRTYRNIPTTEVYILNLFVAFFSAMTDGCEALDVSRGVLFEHPQLAFPCP